MRTSFLTAVMLTATALTTSLQAQTKPALEADAIAFGTREAVTRMRLSPNGQQAVFVGAGPGRTSIVYHIDIAKGETKPILRSSGNPESLRWCGFVSDTRLACRFSAMMSDAGVLLPATRTISMNIDGTDVKQLGQRASDYDLGYRQTDGSIIDWLPGSDETVLMTRLFVPEGHRETPTNIVRTKEGLGVVKLNVRTLKIDQVEAPRKSVATYMSDGRGSVRLLGIAETSGETQLTGRTKYLYRVAGSRDWRDLIDYQEDQFYPLAIDATIDSLYALRKHKGRFALARVTLAATPVETIIATHPRVDIDDVVRSADGQRVVGYTLAEDKREVVYFDPEYRSLSASLGKALPRLPLLDFIETSEDGGKLLLHAGSDNDPGRFLLFDKAAKKLGELMPARPQLEGRALATVRPISYPAADGTQIPAYLTLPPGKESAKGLPALVVPHGGPSSRDEWGFDWLAQFLAARGYAVIQPNYRGSAGYGDDWMNENGFKGWRTSIGDVSAAARYLAAQGIADPKRIAILGWSYGGYAALQSAATEPDLYKAVVAIAPVTDLSLLKSQAYYYTNARMVQDFVGSGPHVEQGSPLRNAAAIRAPVLLVHGDMDVNVGVQHSVRMDSALKSSGKQSELITFKGLDHHLEDSEARALMLSRIGALLERTIGS